MKSTTASLALLAAASLLQADPDPPADWPTFRGGPERVGSDGSAAPAKPKVLWKWRDERDRERICSSPAIWKGRAIYGCDNETVYCVDAAKGGPPLWTFAARRWVFASPVVADGKAYVGEGLHTTTDARMFCLDAETGKKLWDFQTKSHIEAGATVTGGRVYFSAGDDGVYALDAATGRLAWQGKGLHVDSAPLVDDGKVFVGSGYGDHAVWAWDATTGAVLWKVKMPACAWGSPAKGPKGLVMAIGDGNFEQSMANPRSELLCLAPEDGAILWRARMKNTSLSAAAISNGKAYLGNRSGQFGCWDAETGKLVWEFNCGKAVLSSAAIASNAVVYGCDGGHIHALDPSTGKELWKHDTSRDALASTPRIVSSPAIREGRIYFGSCNDWFYCLGEKE
jgi:outer membrane protein assembly factor BamB